MQKIPSLLIVAALAAASSQTNATTLTFATTGAAGVTGASGGPILDQNPSTAGNVLRSGGLDTPGYGSNVSASSASNGAYVVPNAAAATSTVSLAWSVSGGTNSPAGLQAASLDGINTPASSNGKLLLDNWGAGASFSVVFSDSNALDQIALDSFDIYRFGTNTAANRGQAYLVSVTGSTSGVLFSGSVVSSALNENSQTFNFGGSGVLGAVGEDLTLTFTRPSSGELALVQLAIPAATALDTTTNRHAIDNLTFHTVNSSSGASPIPEPSVALLLAAGLPLLRRRLSKTNA